MVMSSDAVFSTVGKLRVSAFQRLKNQRLRTSPSKVMALSKSDKKSITLFKNHKTIDKKYIKLLKNHKLPTISGVDIPKVKTKRLFFTF